MNIFKWKKAPKASTLVVIFVIAVWCIFQRYDPTPPPVLDQVLVLVFGGWFTQTMIEKKSEDERKKKSKSKKEEKEDKDEDEDSTE